MTKKSEAVKRWRKNIKKRIITAMGGKCQICSYDKCNEALVLHHIDPNEKEMTIGNMRANPAKWIIIVEELRKCVLLCHNCHTELHYGIAFLPDDYESFNEDYVDYKSIENPKLLTLCPMCDTLKPEHYKYCSKTCAGKARGKVDWDSIDLLEMMKNQSAEVIADTLGISGAAVRKRYKKIIVE